jgi:hypothetical protein
LALIAAPRKDPMLKAARKVVISAAQTRMELPKKGARTREATSCRPMLRTPREKTKKKRSAGIKKDNAFLPGLEWAIKIRAVFLRFER